MGHLRAKLLLLSVVVSWASEGHESAAGAEVHRPRWLTWLKNPLHALRPHSPGCRHKWEDEFSECPYGHAGFLDVTFPDYEKAKGYNLRVDETLAATPRFTHICIFYSYVIVIVVLNAVVKLVIRRGYRELNHLVFLIVVCCVQEMFVKPFVSQPRPEMSCVKSCGMPSSHSAFALGTLTLHLADTILHSVPRLQSAALLAPGYFSRLKLNEAGASELTGMCHIKKLLVEFHLDLSGVRFDEPSTGHVLRQGFFWLVVVFPIPLSRVQLGDHTEMQVCVGGFVGVFIGFLWAKMTRCLEFKLLGKLGQRCCCGLYHNMALPCGTACNHLCKLPISPDRAKDVLKWYEKETLQRLYVLSQARVLSPEEGSFLKLRWCLLHELMGPLTEEATIVNTTDALSAPLQGWEQLRREFLEAAAKGRVADPEPRRYFSGLGTSVFDVREDSRQRRSVVERTRPEDGVQLADFGAFMPSHSCEGVFS